MFLTFVLFLDKKAIIWGRTDCCRERLTGAILEFLDSNGTPKESRVISLGSEGSPRYEIFEFEGIPDIWTAQVRIEGFGIVQLAELQLEGLQN